ncbi:MAG: VIT domain-containing protein [Candidatus Melainabacteria bacterium]|nr:VIT domain-containing protein [Candidatus Melainabacteria bacterium]
MREATNESLRFLEEMRNEIERKLGAMRVGQGSTTITLPLDSVDITARAVGRVVEVTLTQVFKNPYSEHLEAEYVFPLAGCSSVNGFKMHVGGRTVIGTIQERRLAREEYNRALSEGKRASLLEQERDDVFTMQVGNIPPQEKITVELTYTEKLEFFENGTTELRLPLVVAPRYIPGTALSREQV